MRYNINLTGRIKDIILGDCTLLCIIYVRLIWVALMPATRWSLVAGIMGAQISITG